MSRGRCFWAIEAVQHQFPMENGRWKVGDLAFGSPAFRWTPGDLAQSRKKSARCMALLLEWQSAK
jgi:hypothetical protein